MRLLCAALLTAVAAFGQVATIHDSTITMGGGVPAYGYVRISPGNVAVAIYGGVLSAVLPFGEYTANYTFWDGTSLTQTWCVPVSTGTVTVAQMSCSTASPTSTTATSLQGYSVSANAPASSQVLTWSGSAWAPAAAQGGSFTQAGTGAVNMTAQSKMAQIYNLADFGGRCDGSTVNTAAHSNAFAAIAANGGGTLAEPAGECVTGTVNLPTAVPFKWVGAGVDATTIKLANGTNADLVTQANFASLTGSNTEAGVFQGTLADMTLDGNMTNQSGTSWALRIYGHSNILQNLKVQHGLSGGIYSEYELDTSFSTPADDLEDAVSNVKTIFNGGDGILWRGPHDSVFDGVASYGNSNGWGFHNQTNSVYNGGGLHISHLNTYMNTLGGGKQEDGIICDDCAFTTASGEGQLITAPAGSVMVTKGTWAALGVTALECQNANNDLSGTVANQTVSAVYLNGCQYSNMKFKAFQINAPFFKLTGGAQNNNIEANIESTSSTSLIDQTGQATDFPASNCVQLNMQGPAGAPFYKYLRPCDNGALFIDNTHQFMGVNNTSPAYPLDVQPPQPSSYTFGFAINCPGCGNGYVHYITIAANTYNYTQTSGSTSPGIATALCAAITSAPDPNATCSTNGQYVTVTAALNTGAFLAIGASDQNSTVTLVENYQTYNFVARYQNPLAGLAMLISQSSGENQFISGNSGLTVPATLAFAGPSSAALQQTYLFGKNIDFLNNDASGAWLTMTLHGGTNQGTNPYFKLQNRSGTLLWEGAADASIDWWGSSSLDTGIVRESAGLLQVTNGQGSGYGALDASAYKVSGSAFNFTNLAGSWACGQAAALTGDASSSAGSCATAVTKLNGTSLAGLATGLLKNTTATGVPSIAALADLTALTGTGSTAATNLGLGTAALISSTAGGDLSGTLPSPTVAKLNGTSLAGLATGLLKNTTATGVPSIAVDGADYVSPATLNGGTLGATLASLGTVSSGITAGGAITSNANVNAGSGTATDGALHLGCGASAAYDCVFNGSASSAAGMSVSLPSADGTAGQSMATNGSGVWGWISPLNLNPTAMQTIYNAAGSGNTQINMQDSSSQAGNAAASILLKNNAGTNCSFFGTAAGSGTAMGDCTNYKQLFSGSTIAMSNDTVLKFKNNTSVYAGSYDVGLARASVGGTINVTNGSTCCAAIATSQVVATGTAPTIACGTGAGATPPTGGACAITGGDMAGTIVVTPTATPAASGVLATVTFGVTKVAYPINCDVTWQGTPQALGLWPFVSAANEPSQLANGTWVITAGSTALTASTTYRWGFKCF